MIWDEDKVQIYELRKQGQSFKQLSKRFSVDVSGLKSSESLR
ncbi:IS861, transposase OrfA [Streptococcus pneumoniae]|nr:IS861, transposase OrfA [Streptococcus pneumoniae]VKY39801.1 IS861, transposase OrfA [Streptococcus pneumoniae]VND99682.1 IS861, transposase OrfA [Streptococcus pneumoniae]VNE22781.1 IS861, transposase OrfA [Streptococcus pneumoniae]